MACRSGDDDARFAFGHVADQRSLPEAPVAEYGEHFVRGRGVAGHQQAARGLRVGQQGLRNGRQGA